MSSERLSKLSYQEIGPDLTREVIPKFNLGQYAQPGITFDPICWSKTTSLIDPRVSWDLSASYSLHLFHGAWNNGPQAFVHADGNRLNTDLEYPEGCLYEQLKKRYL
jgi:hypothetical protein